MAWTHDEKSNMLRCVSEKHGRDLTIRLPDVGDKAVYCRECWRYCMFCMLSPDELGMAHRAATGPVTPLMMHFFNPFKPY